MLGSLWYHLCILWSFPPAAHVPASLLLSDIVDPAPASPRLPKRLPLGTGGAGKDSDNELPRHLQAFPGSCPPGTNTRPCMRKSHRGCVRAASPPVHILEVPVQAPPLAPICVCRGCMQPAQLLPPLSESCTSRDFCTATSHQPRAAGGCCRSGAPKDAAPITVVRPRTAHPPAANRSLPHRFLWHGKG